MSRRVKWAFFLCLGLVLLPSIILGRACVFRPATSYPGSHFNRGTNAVWLGVEWVNEPHGADEVVALVDDLDHRQIRTVFAYASYRKPDGQFNPTYAHAAEFIRSLKATQPGLNVQAWIGLPLRYVNLGDATVRAEIAAFCAMLVREGKFDGVHLDPEPISSDDAAVLALLDDVRGALGPEPTLSIATPRIRPILPDAPWPLVGRVAWSAGYYRQVAERADQIAVMTYDSTLPVAPLYRLWMRFQVIEVSRAVEDMGVQLFFGIPTSEEETKTHRPDAENVTSGLQGLVEGLNDAEARPAVVTGAAIYPHWETDEAEWAVYESLWLGRGAR